MMRFSVTKSQRGFTLVELAVVLVIIGIILGAVLKGQELINNARGKRLQSDLKSLETLVWTYYDRKGRWPGDCNVDGIIEFHPANALDPTTALTDETDPSKDACNDHSDRPETADAAYADLRAAGVLNYDTGNNTLARHPASGPVRIGSADDSRGSGAVTNVIVMYRLPAWMAKMIDVSVDGVARGDGGRVRRWDVGVTGGAWPNDADNDKPVTMAYFFDRPLP